MHGIETQGERITFEAALAILAESGWVIGGGYDDPEAVEGERRAFEIVFCAGRDYGRSTPE
jgi:hypothetical protein